METQLQARSIGGNTVRSVSRKTAAWVSGAVIAVGGATAGIVAATSSGSGGNAAHAADAAKHAAAKPIALRLVSISPQDGARYVADRLRDSASSTAGYFVNALRDGRIYAISRQPMLDGGSVGIHQDITPQKQAEAQIAYLARHDALTGVANRRSIAAT